MENCRPIVMRLATLILLACCVAALTACQSLSDVKPGDGRKERLHVRSGVVCGRKSRR